MTSPKRLLLVEIHDARPAEAETIDRLRSLAAETGAGRPALLVTPEWGGARASRRALARLVTPSDTPVLHGLTHDAPPSAFERLLYGDAMGSEFARLGRQEARERIRRGRLLLGEATGRRVEWWCAPRWREPRHVRGLLAELGFEGTLGRRALLLSSGQTHAAPVLSFDHGTRHIVVAANRLVRRLRLGPLLRSARIVRVALHPRDATSPSTVAEVRNLLAALTSGGFVPVDLATIAGGA
ncbi:MAG TPA: hypothetical protein PLP50_01795 [Thermoanaerobaculia bacterium]|nr:hypothetical protein [Thermoanaerobaculia bacterium]HQN06981.1 hypothetical protein [Thermoanaerobaculia bacterium]HQP84983.1 hypothetical protein [Thermoanaerobaculia bacterium]